MRSAEPARHGTTVWDIAIPSQPRRLPGVTMAGFRSRVADPIDLRVVPFPAVTMAVDLGDGMVVVDDAHGGQQRGCVVTGLAPDAVRALGRGIECLQVRLSPVVAHAVLGAAPELGGTVVGLDDLWGRDATRTQEQLRDATSWDDRFAIAEGALARRLDEDRAVDAEVAFAWRKMVASRGRERVEQLATDVGWSRKRLWSRFRSQIGLPPKRAAQLIRFDQAAHRLAAGQSAAQVAAEGGYVDQSHLHREVAAFAGSTPSSLASAPWLSVDDVAWTTSGTSTPT